jgi:S-DNA-T family DNA segregation ATPase FtsK/SpoIIIE
MQAPQGGFSWFSMLPMMGMSLAMGGILYATTQRIPFTIIPIVLMAGMTGGFQWWQAKKRDEEVEAKNSRNSTLFFSDLSEIKRQFEEVAQRQFKVSIKENPSIAKLITRVQMRQSPLWERQIADDDFVSIRLGAGNQPLCVEVDLLDPDHDQPLIDKANKMAKAYQTVDNLPIMANLAKLGSVGLKGQQLEDLYMAFGMVMNLTTHHSPDEVHLYVISHRSDAARRWEWVKWLPHTNAILKASDDNLRLSFSPSTDEELVLPLNREIKRRGERQQSNNFTISNGPHIVLILDKASRLRGHPMIDLIVAQSPEKDGFNLGASIIFVNDLIHPRVNAVAEIRGSEFVYREVWGAGANKVQIQGKADLAAPNMLEPFARSMAPLRTAESYAAGGGGLPSSVRLVEILGAQQANKISLDRLYSNEYHPEKAMSFPVGINTDGKPQQIHLREKGQKGNGQHAILAGGTGGGKSITLQTIVLGLAANHPPPYLNIILADFKAGASELSRLRNLPHVVGFVTDLKPSYVERFRQALEGEITWRKRLFERSADVLGQQVTNIYDYNKLAKDNPLPHLVLVIDEFHKAQQLNESFQETIDNGVAAQGRALGMHLILSTQKAEDFGSVLPNIEVKMSMRMNRAEDSKAIFKRDEAFTVLKRPGQAYLQALSGDMEIFEMFQVARADTDFVENVEAIVETTDQFKIAHFRPDGSKKVIFESAPKDLITAVDTNQKSTRTDADVIVSQIEQFCERAYSNPKDICLEPLESAESFPLFDLFDGAPSYRQWDDEKGWTEVLHRNNRLRLPCGMIDLPYNQRQDKFFIDLKEGDGNLLLIGPQGSGISLLLRTILTGLMATHTPDDFQFYIIGRGSGLGVFESFPHCGGIVRSSTERERVTRLLDFIRDEITRRNQLMSDNRADNLVELRQKIIEESFPSLIVLLESVGTFKDEYESKLMQLRNLIADGKNAGIHFILTNTSMQGVHSNIRDNIQQRIGLGLNSRADYIEVLNRGVEPLDDISGRGYVMLDDDAVEFQSASPYLHQTDLAALATQAEYLRHVAQVMVAQTSNGKPKQIEALAKHIALQSLWEGFVPPALEHADVSYVTAPIGVEFNRLEPVSLDLDRMDPVLFVTGPGQSGKTNALISLTLAAAKTIDPNNLKIIVFGTRRSPLLELTDLPHLTWPNQLASKVATLVDDKDEALRTVEYLIHCFENKLLKRVLIVIDDAQHFFRGNSKLMNAMTTLLALYESSCRVILSEVAVNLTQLKSLDFNGFVRLNLDYGSGLVFSAEDSAMNVLTGFSVKINTNMRRLHKQKIGSGRGFMSYGNKMQVIQIGTIFDKDQPNRFDKSKLVTVVNEISNQYRKPILSLLEDSPKNDEQQAGGE